MPTDLVFGEGPLLGYRLPTSLCPHTVGGTKELSRISFMRALTPFMGVPPL